MSGNQLRRLVLATVGIFSLACCILGGIIPGASAAELPSSAAQVTDLFGRVRGGNRSPEQGYWDAVGRALITLETLEGASYDPETGTLLLVGRPAAGQGPYHLDDLMVALRAKLFGLEPLGMTIEPDQADPRGPSAVVKFFGGSNNTAFGWVMFECDRLLKGLSQGQDNLTNEPLKPEVPDFGNILERRRGSTRKLPANYWNRFWLSQDAEDLEPGKTASKSNGYQPVVRCSNNGLTMRIVHSRMYLRTQVMQMTPEGMQPVPGVKDEIAEQFAIHFSNHYQEFAAIYPEFARLEKLSHLVILADWLARESIPMDTEFIRNYQQQVPVKTPGRTLASTASMETARRVKDGVQIETEQIQGGVDFASHAFFGNDDGSAERLGALARNSQPQHAADIAWPVKSEDGPWQVVAIPTFETRLQPGVRLLQWHVQFRKHKNEKQPIPALPPPTQPVLADSDRFSKVPRVQINLAALDEEYRRANERSANPTGLAPDNSVQLADSDRTSKVVRIPTISIKAPDVRVAQPRGPPTDAFLFVDERHLADSDRSVAVKRVTLSNSDPALQPITNRGPPASVDDIAANTNSSSSPPLLADSDRSEIKVSRVAVQQVSRSEQRTTSTLDTPLGLNLFESNEGGRQLLNLPRLVTWTNPARERTVRVEGVPGTEVTAVDRMSLVSELGDVSIRFGEPQIDQTRRAIFYPPLPLGAYGVRGYFPQNSTLEFQDGMTIRVTAQGYPDRVSWTNGTEVVFRYATADPKADRTLPPVVKTCLVQAKGNEAESGEYDLLVDASALAASQVPAASTIPPSPAEESGSQTDSKPGRPTEKPVPSPIAPGEVATKRAPYAVSANSTTATPVVFHTNPPKNRAATLSCSQQLAIGDSAEFSPRIQFTSPDRACRWTARLRLSGTPPQDVGSSDSSEAKIQIANSSGEVFQVQLGRQEGRFAVSEVASVPLIMTRQPNAGGESNHNSHADLYVDLYMQWDESNGPAEERVSVPVRASLQSSTASGMVVFLGLAGAAVTISLWFVLQRR